MTLQKTYKVSEIIAAIGCNRNEFAYCRRKIGIKARGRGCSSEYTAREAVRIASAFHSLFPARPTQQDKIDELKVILRDSGY